ncbi:MAG TPA: 2-succinyl-5-enolpyruvyl-6-hydroxy-3-cyclohexene-1-carboxylic-acid synthase [Ilumatobacteraceae bacterium]|nr:2-succinyl-5-enolpyruvyl-6-hydroxy-3-cyclohexene-1-carboxylic-acid synthase [Ilumatobacteraceae bacterium]
MQPASDPSGVQATFCATLVDQWVRMGLRHAVIAPGSRSTPMALAFAARDDLDVQVVHDERAASFIALGVGLSTGVPAALLCTSGTAATHFHGAVVEADLSSVPMLVLTADRPPELHGIGAPQTIDQIDLYGAVVRCFADPGPPEAADAEVWREWAEDWWMSAVDGDPGPVHVNLPFREPLVGVAGDLPPVAAGVPEAEPDTWFMMRPDMVELAAMLSAQRGLIVAGRGIDDIDAVNTLATRLGWPILADARSGCRHLPAAICAFDALLRVPTFAAAHRPSVVLHLGEPPASKVLGQWLAAGDATHVQVHAQQRILDPLQIMHERVYGHVSSVCSELLNAMTVAPDDEWSGAWQRADKAAQQAFDESLRAMGGLNEPAVARWLSMFNGNVVTSSSMPVRDLEWFGMPGATTRVFSNRGANGIDGVISSGIGVALATGERTVVHIGDVAFLHDQTALTALAGRGLPLTIVVTDNDGGAIFSFLPQATQLPADRFEQLFGTPHGTDVLMLATAHGLGARDVESIAQLRDAVYDDAVTVVRVRTTRANNVDVHARLNAAVAAALA